MSGKKDSRPSKASTDVRVIGRDGKTEKAPQVGHVGGTGRTIIVGGTDQVNTGSRDQYC